MFPVGKLRKIAKSQKKVPLLVTALLILVTHPSYQRRKPSVCLGLGSVKATAASYLFFLRLLSQLSRCSTVHYHCFEIQNLLLISKERKILKVPMKRNFSYVNIQLIIYTNKFRQKKKLKKPKTRFFRALKCSYFVLKVSRRLVTNQRG